MLQKEIQDIKRGREEPAVIQSAKQEESDEDDFGEFQEAGAYQEIGSDNGNSDSDDGSQEDEKQKEELKNDTDKAEDQIETNKTDFNFPAQNNENSSKEANWFDFDTKNKEEVKFDMKAKPVKNSEPESSSI